ncbi:hypothetical protein BDA99DRAFT_597177 [Phascolomyces articulosus]|uniref:Uncharacterized protein n=1 Tax=Phascolomyces articulosus TaxID=60185 RepID=A0AAD5KFZ7_9FUNG|nr:hypothetical protein BDA99DRAFT_597177 [Phascolomyces articulosus]
MLLILSFSFFFFLTLSHSIIPIMPQKKQNNNKSKAYNKKKLLKNIKKTTTEKSTSESYAKLLQFQYMVEWLETEDNFKLVTGKITGFIPGILKKYTKAHGYKMKGPLRGHKDKYIKARSLTKDVRGSSGAGVNIDDIRTFAEMLEETRPFYERMHALYEEQQVEEGEQQQEQEQQEEEEAQEEQVLGYSESYNGLEASDFDAVYTTSNSADEEDEDEDIEADDEEEGDEDKAVDIARRGFESSFRGFTKDHLHLDEKIYLENKKENKRKACRWKHEMRMQNKKMKNDLMIAILSYLPEDLSFQELKKFRDELFDSK